MKIDQKLQLVERKVCMVRKFSYQGMYGFPPICMYVFWQWQFIAQTKVRYLHQIQNVGEPHQISYGDKCQNDIIIRLKMAVIKLH